MDDLLGYVEGAFCDLSNHWEWPRTSQEGTVYWPSPTRHVKATPVDLDNAKEQFRFRTTQEWVDLFDRAPQIWGQMLGDIFRETRAEAERNAGKARIGRRPKQIDGSLDELHAMITPRYAMEPFAIAVRVLIEEAPSLRAFAKRAQMNHPTLLRLISGEMKLDPWRLEQIAQAGGVNPAYFMEYREMVIIEGMQAIFRQRPNISVGVIKQLRKAQRAS